MTDLSEALEVYKNAQQNPKCGGKTDDHWYVGNPRYQIEADGDEKTSPECYFSSDPSDHEDLVWKNPEFLGTHEYMNDESTFQCPAAFHVFKSKHVKTTGDYNTCCNTYSGEYCRGGNSANEYQLSNLGTDNYHCALTAEAIEAWKKRAPTETLHLCGSAPFHPSKNLKTCPWDYKPGTSFCAPFNNQFCKDKTNHTNPVCVEFAKKQYGTKTYQDTALGVINTLCKMDPRHELCTPQIFMIDPEKTIDAAIHVLEQTRPPDEFIADNALGKQLLSLPQFLAGVDRLLEEDCGKAPWWNDPRCSCFYSYLTPIGAQNYADEYKYNLAMRVKQGMGPLCVLRKCRRLGLKTKDMVRTAETACPKCFTSNSISNLGPNSEVEDVDFGEGGCGSDQGGSTVGEPSSSGLTTEYVVLIIVLAVFLFLCGLLILILIRKRRKNKKKKKKNGE